MVDAAATFLGAGAVPVDPFELQIAAGSSWVRTADAQLISPEVGATIGVTPRLQLAVKTPFLVTVPGAGETDGGLGNAEVELLYNPLRSSALGLAVSGGVAALAPTSSTELIDTAYGASAYVCAYKHLGQVDANLSVTASAGATTESAGPEFDTGVVLSLLVPLRFAVPIVEVGYAHAGEDEIQVAGGLAFSAGDEIELGVAGLVAQSEQDTDWGAVANLTWTHSLRDAR